MVDAVIMDGEFAPSSRFGAGGWRTDVSESLAGTEQRVKKRANPRRRYEVRYNAKDKVEVQALQAFIDDREGRYRGFLIKDITNYQLTDHLILTATGGETTVQIAQLWGSTNQYSRAIRYINEATLTVKVNDVALDGASSPPDYTVSNGLITLPALTASDTVKVTVQFYVPVRFDVEEFFVVPTINDAAHSTIETIPLIEVLEAS